MMPGISVKDIWWNHGGWRTFVLSLYPTTNIPNLVSALSQSLYDGGFFGSPDPDVSFKEAFIVNGVDPDGTYLILHYNPEIQPLEPWLVEHMATGFEGHDLTCLSMLNLNRGNCGLATPVQVCGGLP